MREKTEFVDPYLFKNYPDVLTVRQTAMLLSVCPNTVYKLVREQALPSKRIGVTIRIRKRDVMKFLEARAPKTHV